MVRAQCACAPTMPFPMPCPQAAARQGIKVGQAHPFNPHGPRACVATAAPACVYASTYALCPAEWAMLLDRSALVHWIIRPPKLEKGHPRETPPPPRVQSAQTKTETNVPQAADTAPPKHRPSTTQGHASPKHTQSALNRN